MLRTTLSKTERMKGRVRKRRQKGLRKEEGKEEGRTLFCMERLL